MLISVLNIFFSESLKLSSKLGKLSWKLFEPRSFHFYHLKFCKTSAFNMTQVTSMNQLILVPTHIKNNNKKENRIPDFLQPREQFLLIEIFLLTICSPVVTQTQGVTNMRVLRRNLKNKKIITVNYTLLYINTIWNTQGPVVHFKTAISANPRLNKLMADYFPQLKARLFLTND